MQRADRSWRNAALCALLLIIAVLLSYPVAEIGINDDWSYVRSVKIMAETGHLRYIGWASAMLGWMVPYGALFVRLFGFSFTVVRASNLVLAAVAAFLLQRIFVRCGLNEWNSSLATLTLVLNPVFFPLACTFMTDVAGLLVVLVCFYGCMRALGATSGRVRTLWLSMGCVVSALGGTARQTAWLGLLFIVPSTAFILRKRQLSWRIVGLAWLVSLAFVYGSLRWFNHQPYSLREAVVAGYVDRDLVFKFLGHVLRAGLVSVLLLSPLLIVSVGALRRPDKRMTLWGASLVLLTVVGATLAMHWHLLGSWLAPFDGNTFTARGLEDISEIGTRGVMLGLVARLLLTSLTLLCLFATGAFLLRRANEQGASGHDIETARVPSQWELAIMLGPFSLAYLVLTLHRALFAQLFDRYLIQVLWIAALFFCRTYQGRVARRLPGVSLLLITFMGIFSIAANHDFFALERARVEAANELIAAGIQRDQFFGGWEYDGWTQVDHYGFVNSSYMNTPTGFTVVPPIVLTMKHPPCSYGWSRVFPAIQASYALSFDPKTCAGPSKFPPIESASWLPPYHAGIYIQRVAERTY